MGRPRQPAPRCPRARAATTSGLAAALRQSKKIEPSRALTLAIDHAGVLCEARDIGVIHRDVKPDNIVIEQR